MIKVVQCRVIRWTKKNHSPHASVTDMLETLGWRSLEQKRADARADAIFSAA